MNQPILLYRSGSVYANETAAWAALDAVTHKKGQPIVAFYTLSSPVIGHHGSSTIGAIFAIGIGDGVGQYKACTSHDDMLIVAQSLNAHITQFNQMFEYDANHNAIKAKLDFYTTDGKSISAGGIGSGSSASLGALYQLVDVMANSSNTGVEGAVEGSVLAYDATAGKWKAIAQSEILPDMSGYYTKDETDSAINTAKSNLQGQVDTLQALIPATASATNKLADKDFVNSSIATATAEFRGSFTSLDELKATSGNLNDYAFYLHTDSVGNSVVDRYKWTTAGWLYEYTLNNSSFTAEQWAALNSAITATLVQSYNNHLNNSIIHITAEERTKWNNKWDYNEETIKAVKVNAAISADKATKLATARKIWGQSFDGSGDVSGDIHLGNESDFEIGTGYDGSNTYRYNKIVFGAGGTGLQYISGRWTGGNVVVHNFKVGLNDTTALAITNNGNILIGTTTDNGYKLQVNGKGYYSDDLIVGGEVVAVAGEGTPAGVTDYSALTGKPLINGVTLVSGNNTLAALGIQAAGDYATNSGVTTLLADYATKTFVSNNYVGKTAFNNHTTDTNIHITSAERTAWDSKWDYDEATIKAVKVNSASSADSVAWAGISGKPTTFTPSAHTHTASDVSGLPTSLKNPYALTFGSKTYDGSAAATITASDLGALTAHQSIYALTLQVNGTSKGVYNPASAAKTINIAVPTKTSDITNNSGFITSASIPTALKNPYAVEIKANGVSLGTYDGSAAATFNLSAANVGAANKVHTHTASEISGLSTNLSAFNNDVGYITGITKSMVEGVLTGDITSHTHSQYITSLPYRLSQYITDEISDGNGFGRISSGSPFVSFVSSSNSDCMLITTAYSDIWRGELALDYRSNNIAYRNKNNGTWSPWAMMLSTSNYNSYAPTLTGTGASGTWGIDISGNAATATTLYTKQIGYTGTAIVYYKISGILNTSITTTIFRITTRNSESYLLYVNTNDNQIVTPRITRERNIYSKIISFAWSGQDLYIIAGSYSNGIYITQINGTAISYNITTTDESTYNSATSITIDESAFLTSNVASATKLQTPRTIWGRYFDGSTDVSGNIHLGNGSDFEIGTGYDGSNTYRYNKIVFGAGGTGLQYISGRWTGGNVVVHNFKVGLNDTTALAITNNGNILIGTTTDNGYKLQVAGSERVYGDLIVDGEVSALVA